MVDFEEIKKKFREKLQKIQSNPDLQAYVKKGKELVNKESQEKYKSKMKELYEKVDQKL